MQSSRLISDSKEVDAAWLYDVLKRSGALGVGQVNAFDLTCSESVNASIARIHVDYESGSVGTKPRFLLLKICKNEAWFLRFRNSTTTHVYVCVKKEQCTVLPFEGRERKLIHARRLVLTKWFNFGSNGAVRGPR